MSLLVDKSSSKKQEAKRLLNFIESIRQVDLKNQIN